MQCYHSCKFNWRDVTYLHKASRFIVSFDGKKNVQKLLTRRFFGFPGTGTSTMQSVNLVRRGPQSKKKKPLATCNRQALLLKKLNQFEKYLRSRAISALEKRIS